MKKWIIIYILAAIVLFSGASPWEGAAAVAPDGELPSTGFYVATNSFPKNTVVDITNIETNKSTRVIVANNLDTPDLLAIVSREAAELIGMRAGSIGRIRMVQPVEPISYSRFTDGIASGNPLYDSGNVIANEIYNEDTYKPPVSQPDNGSAATGPSYVLEPEWRTRDVIVDLYGYEPEIRQPEEIVEEAIAEIFFEEEEEVIEDAIAESFFEEEEEIIEDAIVESFPEEEEEVIEEVIAESFIEEEEDEVIEEAIVESLPEEEEEVIEEAIAESFIEEEEDEVIEEAIVESLPEEEEEIIEDAIVEQPVPEQKWIIVPAEDRPPESLYGINPADIIPEITAPPPQQTETVIPPAAPTETVSSVSSVSQLDRGWYYVQIAAFERIESVENIIKDIDQRYSPLVFRDSDNLYKVLLGPLNQGESSAVLQRFKSIGYTGAFVRHVR